MRLNNTIRALIRQGATIKLVRLLPNEATGATRARLIRNIMRRNRRAVLAAWPT
jgi:hypothetical protein